jgi:hypothetical protein
MSRKRSLWVALWLVLVVVTGILAFGPGSGSMVYGPWHGWGRMGGWGDEPQAYGTFGGYGMGPEMMGGMGIGRGWGMGTLPYAMMGQVGAGTYGMGATMGYGQIGGGYVPVPGPIPDLKPEQAQQISQLQQEALARNSSLAQQLWAAQDKLNLLRMSEKRDWDAIRAATQTVFDLQRQQLNASIDVQQKIDGVLTEGQRQERARNWRGRGGMGGQ